MREITKCNIELQAASFEKVNGKTVHRIDKVFYPLLPQVNPFFQMFINFFSHIGIIFCNQILVFENFGVGWFNQHYIARSDTES